MKINPKGVTEQEIEKAAQVLKQGGLVLFPTETVYGIGANGLDEEAVKKIYEAKGRESDNPLILHIASQEMLPQIATNISEIEAKLMEHFWPGPLTLILKRTNQVPDRVTAGLETVGVRMPSEEIAQKLISKAGIPIAAPSANISGRPSGTNIQDIWEELSTKVDVILDGGKCEVGLESTVVKVVDNVPIIVRPGKVTKEEIQEAVGCVQIDPHILQKTKIKEDEKVISPGMKYRHYAPKTKCILIYSKDNKKMIQRISEEAKHYQNPIILCTTENSPQYKTQNKIELGSRENLEEIAKHIFTDLRKADKTKSDIIIIEGVSQEGLGLAIMNRLVKASGNQFIEVE